MKTRMLLNLFLSVGLSSMGMAQGLGGGFPSPLIQNVTNAPNPFDSRRGGTQISYQLSSASAVHITVFDLFGVNVRHWDFSANDIGGREGWNGFLWDGTNAAGQKVSKGGYLALIEVDTASGSAKTLRKIGVIH
jgi:hypothetical protein